MGLIPVKGELIFYAVMAVGGLLHGAFRYKAWPVGSRFTRADVWDVMNLGWWLVAAAFVWAILWVLGLTNYPIEFGRGKHFPAGTLVIGVIAGGLGFAVGTVLAPDSYD